VTVWWWVRHGPTHQKVLTGWRDVPADLSDAAQIARLDAALPSDALLLSSDLARAVATADALQAGRRRLPHARDLREFHFGDWEGLPPDEVAARDPDLSRRYWSEPGDCAPPGGESWNAAAGRVERAVADLSRRHAGEQIVAVAHMGVILTQVARAGGQSPSQALAHAIAPFSITRIGVSNRNEIIEINRIP